MASEFDYDLVILGAGPGGYVAAIRAAQLKLSVAIIEKDKPGGVCLNIGCIPSKSLIHQAELYSSAVDLEKMGIRVDRSAFDYSTVHAASRKAADTLSKGVAFLLKKNGITVISGKGVITARHEVTIDDEKKITGKNIVIATGSRPREIPGFEFDEERILSSTGALMLKKPPEKMLILGGGAIGIEFAYIMNSFGVSVQVVEMLDRILPNEDEEVTALLTRVMNKKKITVSTATKALSQKITEGGVEVVLENTEGEKNAVMADVVLVVVGRTPNTGGIGLETVGITMEKGYIPVGDFGETSVPGIFAIGDCVPTPLLAHVASKEGEIVVEHIAGLSPVPKIDPGCIPGAIYCEPQIAGFGLTEQEARRRGISYEKATFPYRGAGKAVAVGKPDGMVKIITAGETRELLGAHIIGAQATELIHELLLGKCSELLPEDIAAMIHAHPTLSEAVMEAARASEGWAIHV
jgi:dihydrolipoamide dehydrogenase